MQNSVFVTFPCRANECRSGWWTDERSEASIGDRHIKAELTTFSSGAVPVSTLPKCTFDTNKPQTGPFPPGGFERFKKFDSQSRGFFFFPSSWFCRVPLIICLGDDDKQPTMSDCRVEACCAPKTTKGIRNPKRSETRTEGGRWSEPFVFLLRVARVWLFFFLPV